MVNPDSSSIRVRNVGLLLAILVCGFASVASAQEEPARIEPATKPATRAEESVSRNGNRILLTPSRNKPAPALPAERPATNRPTGGAAAKPAVSTVLQFDILISRQQADTNAQTWGKLFEKLGHQVSIRAPRDETLGVQEREQGSLRFVTATGQLNRQGDLSFGRQKFTLDESAKLAEWIADLTVYGAQGSPDGQPMWGLSQVQFEELYALLTRPLPVDTAGQEVRQLIAALRAEHQLPIRLHSTMEAQLDASTGQTVLTNIHTGFSTGTGLAVALNEIGAGFRPTRTPTGAIELEVLPLEQLRTPWPMGWEPKEETPRHLILPALFKNNPAVELEDAILSDLLVAIASETKTPIVIDERKCLARKVDVRTTKVSYPPKQNTAWMLVVASTVRKVGLDYQVRQDEAGRGFLLIAPFSAQAPAK